VSDVGFHFGMRVFFCVEFSESKKSPRMVMITCDMNCEMITKKYNQKLQKKILSCFVLNDCDVV
jgi:hypothetical protein